MRLFKTDAGTFEPSTDGIQQEYAFVEGIEEMEMLGAKHELIVVCGEGDLRCVGKSVPTLSEERPDRGITGESGDWLSVQGSGYPRFLVAGEGYEGQAPIMSVPREGGPEGRGITGRRHDPISQHPIEAPRILCYSESIASH